MIRTLYARGAALLAAALLVAGCSTPTAAGPDPAPVNSAAPPVVFAAASLKGVFEQLAKDAGVPAEFSFDGSSGLVDQIAGGAPADVFASADGANMDRAVAEGLIEGEPVRFATNVLVLVTPPDNPAGVTGFDASLDGTRLVVCAPEVPCGRATAKLAEAMGLVLAPVSEESKVTDVLGKVVSGEADAGLVYATDAAKAGDSVRTFPIAEAAKMPNEYWIAAVRGGDAAAARAFLDAVGSESGKALLAEFGFGAA